MTPFWSRFTCIIVGCIPGGWLPATHDEPLVQAYVRQCRRCLRLEQRGYVISQAPAANSEPQP